MSKGHRILPRETPVEPRASAQPRYRTNHFATVTLTTSGPASDAPAAPPMTVSNVNTKSDSIVEIYINVIPRTVAPIAINFLAPY